MTLENRIEKHIDELVSMNYLCDTRSEWLDVLQDVLHCDRDTARQVDQDYCFS